MLLSDSDSITIWFVDLIESLDICNYEPLNLWISDLWISESLKFLNLWLFVWLNSLKIFIEAKVIDLWYCFTRPICERDHTPNSVRPPKGTIWGFDWIFLEIATLKLVSAAQLKHTLHKPLTKFTLTHRCTIIHSCSLSAIILHQLVNYFCTSIFYFELQAYVMSGVWHKELLHNMGSKKDWIWDQIHIKINSYISYINKGRCQKKN